MELIKIKKHTDIDLPQKINIGDWIDLRCAEDVSLKKGEFKNISLGVSMKLPKGYEALVVPRSSLFKNHGVILVNSVGVIDNSYSGTNDIWGFPVYATKDTTIKKNERICQFRILFHQPFIEFEEVQELDDKNRGGFGSTGRE